MVDATTHCCFGNLCCARTLHSSGSILGITNRYHGYNNVSRWRCVAMGLYFREFCYPGSPLHCLLLRVVRPEQPNRPSSFRGVLRFPVRFFSRRLAGYRYNTLTKPGTSRRRESTPTTGDRGRSAATQPSKQPKPILGSPAKQNLKTTPYGSITRTELTNPLTVPSLQGLRGWEGGDRVIHVTVSTREEGVSSRTSVKDASKWLEALYVIIEPVRDAWLK
jgi:hypothetical protein